MKKILPLLALLLLARFADAQTEVSGLITTNTTLYAANSPYIVSSDNLIVSGGVTLTIQPGVELRFSSGKKLEVRGHLSAVGTAADSITFTSTTGTGPGSWTGIDLLTSQGVNGNFEYCKFLYASTAINEWCCGSGRTTVRHSRFSRNTTAMGGYTGGSSTVSQCTFSYNVTCITQADKAIDNSTFVNNQYGLYQTERVSVSNSTFQGHTEIALLGGRGTVSNCVITNNTIGVSAFFEGFTITNSTISNNGKGIITGFDTNASISSSRICDNTTYNIEHRSTRNFSATGNCFCSSDSTAIEAKIYDGFDANALGLVNFSRYDADCATLIENVDKTLPRTVRLEKINSPYQFDNDLVIRSSDKLIIEPGVELRFAAGKKLDVRGQLTAIGTANDSITFTSLSSNSPGAWSGINLLTSEGVNATFEYCKFLYASTAIYETCCGPGKTTVKHSRFTSNSVGMGGYTGRTSSVTNCKFTQNVYSITQADKEIDHSEFTNNQYGLYRTERVSVSNSTFHGHSEVALDGGRGTLSNCTVTNNTIGVQAFFEGFTINNCTISNNGTGIITGFDFVQPITNSRICNNSTFNIYHQSTQNLSLAENCFCSSDSTSVEEKIYDGYDQAIKGLISFSLYSEDCGTLIKQIDKTSPRTIRLVKAHSPYDYTDNLVIRATDMLIIEPGVNLRFAAGKKLEVRGKINATGALGDSITFTAINGAHPGSWGGINLVTSNGATGTFEYCRFLYASTAINETCCGSGSTTVKHSRFTANSVAMGGYTGHSSTISECTFSSNDYAITQADKTISNSKFINNQYGLYQTERVNVSNSVFENNTGVALDGGRGIVSNCTITNNAVGVVAFFEGFTIKNSTISNNGKGIVMGFDTSSPITDSKICNNSTYNIQLRSNRNFTADGNCFCTSDSTTIEEKIFDGYDNSSLGLLQYYVYEDRCKDVMYQMVINGRLKEKVDVQAFSITKLDAQDTIREDSGLSVWHSDLRFSKQIALDTSKFVLTISNGENYSVVGNRIIPAKNFYGTLDITFHYTNNSSINLSYSQKIFVSPVNDPPVIKAFNGNVLFSPEGTLQINLADFDVEDPDTDPTRLSLIIIPQSGYTVNENEVKLTSFKSAIDIPVIISDKQSSDTLSISARANVITSVEQSNSSIGIYPNPFSDRFLVGDGNAVRVFNSLGQEIQFTSEDGAVDSSGFTPGIYLVVIDRNGLRYLIRGVKK